MLNTEIQFWRAHSIGGTLIKAARLYKERAVKFFGARDVANENELALLLTLDSYEIINKSDQELLAEITKWGKLTDSDVMHLADDVREKVLAKQRSTEQIIVQLRASARKTVFLATGYKL